MLLQSCIVLLVTLGACVTDAQLIELGRCSRKIQAKTNFTAPAFLGKWYEYSNYFAILELGGKCITAEYGLNADGSISVLNKQINVLTLKESSMNGTATFVNNDSTVAKLTVKFPLSPPAPYWVLSTDYVNYAVVYSCEDVLIAKGKILWVLTRARNPTKEVVDKAYADVKKFGLSTRKLKKTSQTGCQPC